MVALLSGGDIDTIINAAAALFDLNVSQIGIEERFPAKLAVIVDIAQLSEEARQYADIILTLLKRVLLAGVGFEIDFITNITPKAKIKISAAVVTVKIYTIRQEAQNV
jgi:hypothetical protein